jgi:hypothetical protein
MFFEAAHYLLTQFLDKAKVVMDKFVISVLKDWLLDLPRYIFLLLNIYL